MSNLTERMRRDWDERARENYRFYIASGTSHDEDAFFESGRQELGQLILDGLDLQPEAIVVEIGCGVGRLLQPLAQRVARAVGVDISPEMIERARGLAERRGFGPEHLRFEVTDGSLSSLEDGSVDYVFSYIVFQHVPEAEPVARYIQEAARVLKPGGVLRFQVDGRTRRRGSYAPGTYEGRSYSRDEILELLAPTGLVVLDEWGEDTHYYWITSRLPGGPAAVVSRIRIGDDAEREQLVQAIARAAGQPAEALLKLSLRRAVDPLLERLRDASVNEIVETSFRVLLGRAPLRREMAHHVEVLDKGLESPESWIDTVVSCSELRDRLSPLFPRLTDGVAEALEHRLERWRQENAAFLVPIPQAPSLPPGGEPLWQAAALMQAWRKANLDRAAEAAVELIYALVLERKEDPGAISYWAEKLRSRELTPVGLFHHFAMQHLQHTLAGPASLRSASILRMTGT